MTGQPAPSTGSTGSTGSLPYLSDAWLAEASRALADRPPLPHRLVIGYRVTDGPDGETRHHHLALGPDRLLLGPGLDGAELVLTLDWDLAVAIHRGEAGAQRAVLDGRITVTGDPGTLLGYGPYLSDVEDHLADLRTRTVYR